MTASARGLLVAAGTAAVVLVVGVVFVFGGGQPPSEKPAAAKRPDESDLSLEARRQARLAQSQAMLGGGRAAPLEPEPVPEAAVSPLPPSAPVAEPVAGAPIRPAPPAPEPVPPAPPPKEAVVVVPLPAPEPRCTIATSGTSPVAEACRQGGIPEAKRTMKRLVGAAKAHRVRFTCEKCHLDLDSFTLRENARSDFAALLAAAK